MAGCWPVKKCQPAAVCGRAYCLRNSSFFSRAISAQVTFGKGPHDHGFTCEIVAYAPQGVVLKATDRAAAAPAAFDAAADKVEKQLRRHTRRLKDHHSPAVAELEEADDHGQRRGGAEPRGD